MSKEFDSFDEFFDEVEEESLNKNQEVEKGKKTKEYSVTGICVTCDKSKNNVSAGTGSCFECDEGPEEIPEDVPDKKDEETKEDDFFDDFEEPEEKPKKPKKKVEPKPKAKAKAKAKPKPKPEPETEEEEFFKEGDEVKTDFDLEEDDVSDKAVFTLYGAKGSGKTAVGESFPGEIAVLSFDFKSAAIKKHLYKDDKRIHVYNVMKYSNSSSPMAKLSSSEAVFNYILALLEKFEKEDNIDWIMIDGIEVFQRQCEFLMRYRNGIAAYAGIANRNLWKERRQYLQETHRASLVAAKKGVIYTTYTDKHEVIEDGQFIVKEDIPKWVDVVMMETDVVVKTSIGTIGKEKRFFAEVESSKYHLVKDRVKHDVTFDENNPKDLRPYDRLVGDV